MSPETREPDREDDVKENALRAVRGIIKKKGTLETQHEARRFVRYCIEIDDDNELVTLLGDEVISLCHQ